MTENAQPKRLYQWGLLDELPPLVDLPVIRDTYCSQEMTDRALMYLWEKEPELVRAQGKVEQINYDAAYVMELGRIVEFFQKATNSGIKIPITRLGMLDLVFELSRRLRKALEIPEYEIKGRSFAKSPEDSMPDLPALPIQLLKNGKPPFDLTQEVVDRIIAATYKKRPDLFYEFSEILRRGGIWPHDTFNELKKVFLDVRRPEEKLDSFQLQTIGGELNRRISKFCEINRA